MQQVDLPFNNSLINVNVWGNGPCLLLCFHGYGETAMHFQFLQALKNNYTVAAIDLPFHGQTTWNETGKLKPQELVSIIEILETRLRATNLQLQEKITLLGYSLGGRIALSLYQLMAGKINKLVLLAPDGLKLNRWYWLATQTTLGNRLFKYTVQHPGWFFTTLNLLNKVGAVNSSIYKFVNYYIADPVVRNSLYNRWTTLSLFKPDLNNIKKQITQQATRINLIYGKYDRIILPVVGERFKNGIERYCTIQILPAGHQVLHQKWLPDIEKALNT